MKIGKTFMGAAHAGCFGSAFTADTADSTRIVLKSGTEMQGQILREGDGLSVSNVDAYNDGTSPDANITENYDRDGDGMTDVWEVANGLNPDDASDAGGDPDGDGYNNLAEFQRGTDPHVADVSPEEMQQPTQTTNENLETIEARAIGRHHGQSSA